MRLQPTCLTEGCTRPEYSRGYCKPEYERLRTSGAFRGVPFPRKIRRRRLSGFTPEERYEAKVDRSGGPDACHPWTASVNEHGYGIFRAEGQMQLAHRWAYKRFVGPVGPKEVVRHSCDNPPCQNRRHWLKGVPADNVADMIERGRMHDRRGTRNPRAKLTEAQVREIRAAAGTHPEVAERYGVSRSLVGQIRNGKAWGHIR